MLPRQTNTTFSASLAFHSSLHYNRRANPFKKISVLERNESLVNLEEKQDYSKSCGFLL